MTELRFGIGIKLGTAKCPSCETKLRVRVERADYPGEACSFQCPKCGVDLVAWAEAEPLAEEPKGSGPARVTPIAVSADMLREGMEGADSILMRSIREAVANAEKPGG